MGRTRLSTLTAGVVLLVMILALGDLVAAIPMGALVAVMVMVSISTFDWSSIRLSALKRTPLSETAVMVTTVAIVVATHSLAYGVVAGVLLAAIFFASTNELIHSFERTDALTRPPSLADVLRAAASRSRCAHPRHDSRAGHASPAGIVCAVGEVFAGRYELIDLLDEGGVGVVWRAWDRRTEQYVAAKVLRQVDASSLVRFVREQSFRIDHEHVVMPLGWAGEDDRVLFTMPLVAGGSLATLIGDYGPLPPAWVALLMDQLLDALQTIHDAGLVHRDIKPANLLLEPTGSGRPHLRLSDFGIAAAVDQPRLTHTDVVLGTPGYLAPEALRGADPDPRQDIFAVGMTAVEMLTGARPGRDAARGEVVAGLDPAQPLTTVVTAMIADDPAQRPASAAAVRTLLAGLVPPPGTVPDMGELDIEVFDQLPPLPSIPVPAPPVAAATRAAVQPATATMEAPAQRTRSRRPLIFSIVVVAAGCALIAAAVLRSL